MLSQHKACVREHDDTKVEADSPQRDNDTDAVHALRL